MTSATGLKRLYRTNSTARMLFDYLASRSNNRETTNFNRIMQIMTDEKEPPTRARIREVFRTLQKLGYGEFIVGRRGYPTRFVWSAPLTEVGATAQMPSKPIRARAKLAGKRKGAPGRRKSDKVAA